MAKGRINSKAPVVIGTKFGAIKNKGVRTAKRIDAALSSVGGATFAIGAMTGNPLAAGIGAGLAVLGGKKGSLPSRVAKTTAMENLIRRGKTGNTLGASGVVKAYSYVNSKGTTVNVPERQK